jgi:hypothetical protein
VWHIRIKQNNECVVKVLQKTFEGMKMLAIRAKGKSKQKRKLPSDETVPAHEEARPCRAHLYVACEYDFLYQMPVGVHMKGWFCSM